MFLNRENIDLGAQDEKQGTNPKKAKQHDDTIHEENEKKRLAQLRKLQLHKDDNEHKKDYILTMTQFGELLVKNNLEEIRNTLLTEDCETFLFNLAEMSPALYAFTHQGFVDLWKGFQIIQREVKETYMDLNKTIGFQFCFCVIKNEKDGSTISQFSSEAFSFQNKKISKHRAIFGNISSLSEGHSLFRSSEKEKMFAKVKELNYAWADQPDLEKIASLLHENTEFKIWRWKDNKSFIFNKQNLTSEFRTNLEDDFVIKSIVPFDPAIEAQYILGTYVYYLEGKGKLSGKRYQWISTCIYAFDRDLNIAKMSKQGQLYEEDEIRLPFEVYSAEKIREKIEEIYTDEPRTNISLINSTKAVKFSYELGLFSSSKSPVVGLIKGLSEYNKLIDTFGDKIADFGRAKLIESYFGCDHPFYDTAITIDYAKGFSIYNNKLINLFGIKKYSFENGRLAKSIVFFVAIPEPIPSPYDNDFADHNIRPKHEFLQK